MIVRVDQPPNPWEQIGLPAAWAPAPVAWRFAKIQANGPDGPQTIHVLIIDSANGRHAFAFPPEGYDTLIRGMQEQATGLTIAGKVELNGGRLRTV